VILNDPEVVRTEYATEHGLEGRRAAYRYADGPDAREVAFAAIAEGEPGRVLEVGAGPGELAERIRRELGAALVAIDISPRMVELARRRGVDARVGDAQDLPFDDGEFDCAVAAWMLYHVPDVDRGLRELRRVLRPGGRLVAVTNSERNLTELWAAFGDRAARRHPFSAENGEWPLLRWFTLVERRDVRGTVTFADWDAARRYVAASTSRAHLAGELPCFEGPLRASRHVVVFVCEP
jgi:SAM-dependent methyltransferase